MEHLFNQVHCQWSSRRVIFASTAASHSMIGGDGSFPVVLPRIDGGEDNDVATAKKEDDFPAVDDKEGLLSKGGEVHPQQDPRDSSIFEEEASETVGVEEEDVSESSMLVACQKHINSLNDKGLKISLYFSAGKRLNLISFKH
jgi:hypothetical protein